jgi:hypothetical protein
MQYSPGLPFCHECSNHYTLLKQQILADRGAMGPGTAILRPYLLGRGMQSVTEHLLFLLKSLFYLPEGINEATAEPPMKTRSVLSLQICLSRFAAQGYCLVHVLGKC